MSDTVSDPETYFRQFLPRRTDLFHRLEKEAAEEEIPIVGPLVGELLHLLVAAVGAERVLELGTATGYSALYMASAMTPGGSLVTLENDPEMAQRAREHIRRAGMDNRIEVQVGDALSLMTDMAPAFDFVFMDIEKVDYIRALASVRRLLRPGGLLVADNVAFVDADRFNQGIYVDPGWRAVPLMAFLPGHSPEHDAICMALRR